MKNILSNKKWLNIIALLLLVIFLNSCSEGVENVSESGEMGSFSPLLGLWSLYLLFICGYSIYIVFVALSGYYLDRDKIMVDGKVHTIERFEETNVRKLTFEEILEVIFEAIYRKSISIILGGSLCILIFMMTGKINIWLDILTIGLCQYVAYLFVKKNPIIIRGLFYVILVSIVLTLVIAIIIGINNLG